MMITTAAAAVVADRSLCRSAGSRDGSGGGGGAGCGDGWKSDCSLVL